LPLLPFPAVGVFVGDGDDAVDVATGVDVRVGVAVGLDVAVAEGVGDGITLL
jgi:hypothetical protein